jgi:hypothetical protein
MAWKLFLLAAATMSFSHAFQTTMKTTYLQSSRFAATTRTTTSTICRAKSSSTKNTETPSEISFQTRQKCWRPTIQDVEAISFGKPAKKKGTGSRGVPHRLNENERKLFDQSRQKGFLEVIGSGWRAQRSDAPLLNTYRSLCDARGQVCIVLHKGNTGMDDELVIDLSPLRLPDTFESVGKDVISLIDLPVETGELDVDDNVTGDTDDNDKDEEEEKEEDESSLLAWEERPIYQLRPYCISWVTDRSEGKKLGKRLASVFQTAEPKASKSKNPKHRKPGKNRRSGGYGIG